MNPKPIRPTLAFVLVLSLPLLNASAASTARPSRGLKSLAIAALLAPHLSAPLEAAPSASPLRKALQERYDLNQYQYSELMGAEYELEDEKSHLLTTARFRDNRSLDPEVERTNDRVAALAFGKFDALWLAARARVRADSSADFGPQFQRELDEIEEAYRRLALNEPLSRDLDPKTLHERVFARWQLIARERDMARLAARELDSRPPGWLAPKVEPAPKPAPAPAVAAAPTPRRGGTYTGDDGRQYYFDGTPAAAPPTGAAASAPAKAPARGGGKYRGDDGSWYYFDGSRAE